MSQQSNHTAYPVQNPPYNQLADDTEPEIPQGSPIARDDSSNQNAYAAQVQQQQQQQQQQNPMYPPYYMYPQMPNAHPQQFQVVNPQMQPHIAQMYPVLHHQPNIHQGQNLPQIQQPMITVTRYSQQLPCQGCNQVANSSVVYENGTGTYVAGALIAACGFWLGCCLLPCVMDDCKDARHICSKCGNNLGKKRFLFD